MYPQGHQDAFPLDHMGNSTACVSYPTLGGIEVLIENVNAAMKVCDYGAKRGRGDTGYFWGFLDGERCCSGRERFK